MTMICDMCGETVQNVDKMLEVGIRDSDNHLVFLRLLHLCKSCEHLLLKRIREACP